MEKTVVYENAEMEKTTSLMKGGKWRKRRVCRKAGNGENGEFEETRVNGENGEFVERREMEKTASL